MTTQTGRRVMGGGWRRLGMLGSSGLVAVLVLAAAASVARAGPGTTTTTEATTTEATTTETTTTASTVATTSTTAFGGTFYSDPQPGDYAEVLPGTTVPVGTVLRVLAYGNVGFPTRATACLVSADGLNTYHGCASESGFEAGEGEDPTVLELATEGLEPGPYEVRVMTSISGGGEEFITVYEPIAVTLTPGEPSPAAEAVSAQPSYTG